MVYSSAVVVSPDAGTQRTFGGMLRKLGMASLPAGTVQEAERILKVGTATMVFSAESLPGRTRRPGNGEWQRRKRDAPPQEGPRWKNASNPRQSGEIPAIAGRFRTASRFADPKKTRREAAYPA
ncbi:MAG TPA: hypothetical protein VMV61_04390 [Patescibacteria group bacterium]|nr:hypothetical protein [Patescibacteria group bacterium]